MAHETTRFEACEDAPDAPALDFGLLVNLGLGERRVRVIGEESEDPSRLCSLAELRGTGRFGLEVVLTDRYSCSDVIKRNIICLSGVGSFVARWTGALRD